MLYMCRSLTQHLLHQKIFKMFKEKWDTHNQKYNCNMDYMTQCERLLFKLFFLIVLELTTNCPILSATPCMYQNSIINVIKYVKYTFIRLSLKNNKEKHIKNQRYVSQITIKKTCTKERNKRYHSHRKR